MSGTLRAGDRAKEFILYDQHDNEVRLSHFKGKKVILSFHPLAWTIVCAEQMRALEANRDSLARLNAAALGISVDTTPSKNAWAREIGVTHTRLLSDFWPHGETARTYGLLNEARGYAERANVLLDEEHRVMLVRIYPIAELPNLEEILQVLGSAGR
jgi:peroxiredoxin